MAYIPSVWVMAGLMVLAIGYLPRFTGAVWLYLGYAFFIAYLGDMLKLPEWMDYLSPFGHIPQIPLEEFHASKTLLSMLLAFGLTAAGFAGYRNPGHTRIDSALIHVSKDHKEATIKE